MNFELSQEQQLTQETFARFLNEQSAMDRVRAALPSGFDEALSKRKGPAGFLNQCYRHSQGTTIHGGTSEIHGSMIAERALNLPRTRA
jgi:3-oxochol-4-en-24-oyl-CoA dehydrogenase